MKLAISIVFIAFISTSLYGQSHCFDENKSLKVVNFEVELAGDYTSLIFDRSEKLKFSLIKIMKANVYQYPRYLYYSGDKNFYYSKKTRIKGILRKAEISTSLNSYSCWFGTSKKTVYILNPIDFNLATLKSKTNYYADCSSFQPEKMD